MNDTWSHIAARALVRPLLGTPVRPNHITAVRLATGAAACLLLVEPSPAGTLWAGALWIVSTVLDSADGELARIGDMRSRRGHLFDYYSDIGLNSAFFVCAGLGLRHGAMSGWGPVLGLVAGAAMLACCWLSEVYERLKGPGSRTWRNAGGLQLDDGLYLLGPAIWLGWLAPITAAAAVCTGLLMVVIAVRLAALRRRIAREATA